MKAYFLLAWLLTLFSLSASAAIDVYQFDSPAHEKQFQELSHTLRCPKCQNNSIADSNAALAKDLRYKVYAMTKAGKSKQEIVNYMVARYGEFITYNPPVTTGTIMLWGGPILVVFCGVIFLVVRARRSPQADSPEFNDEAHQAYVDTLIRNAENDKELNK
ncbi:cytochrome c-type biogenesis protein CcmH [Vibrio zhugei]|uniref:Cytochrome c-type biogenesis protein n=1 Tax=Vibrio zhugei TaxID=2479546 RepID=A0ABV7CDP7_9VIBR|nr:cytochrome c-type biogenesis protein [Vibrio zhugei]